MSSVITAVAIPSLYALYVWYAHRTLDIPRQRRGRGDVPVALVASSTVKLRSDHRMSIKSVFAVDQPSPPVSNVLYTSRGDVAVNLNKDELSTDALAYLMEVTDSEALVDDDNDDAIIITRTEFDDMIQFAAAHLHELPFASVQTMSFEPRTSLASLLAQVTDNEAKTPLSQIFLLVDDDADQTSTSSSSAPPSSIVREIATSSSQARPEEPQTIHVSKSKTKTRRPFGKQRASHPQEQEYFVFT